MTILRRVAVLLVLGSTSVALVACGADTSGPPPHETTATAQPLVESCQGAFSCTDGDSTVVLTFSLMKKDDACRTDKDEVFTPNHRWLTKGIDGTQMDFGSWSGDSHAFELCDPVTCFQCTNDAEFAGSGNAGDQPSRCSGRTSCDDFSAGNCGNHQGCNLHGHAVYSFGMFDHYEDECQGSTPSCSSHTTEDECKRQDCTWK